MISAKLYIWFSGPIVMGAFLASIGVLFLQMPYNTSLTALHFEFFFLGVATAVTDTGCQIMTRKLHGKTAGPWLGANTVVFGLAGALVPLIEFFTSDHVVEYHILMIVCFLVAFTTFSTPDVNTLVSQRSQSKPGEGGNVAKHYHVEVIIAFMVFMFIGFAIGRLAGVYDQRFVTNTTLPVHLFIQSAAAALSMLLILLFPHTASALWIGITFFGLFNGPCIGYCYDYNNRLTYPSELSMAIVMIGLNFGASVVPWFTSYLWTLYSDAYVLIWVCFICNLFPMCLVFVVRKFSYDPKINPAVKREEETTSA
eukprot:GSChrysophyteH2.ASY1.ANO1.648.1 assembled CDS